MRLNYFGIVAGVIAFVSLVLPWWTMTMSAEFVGIKMSWDVSVYTYDARITVEAMGGRESESIVNGFSLWYGYVAFALILMAGVAGIVGSLMVGKKWKDDYFRHCNTRVDFHHNLCSGFTR